MKLKRLELTNVGLYEKFETDFQEGLIGIFGPQGSGKTTAVNAAYAALTNSYSRFVGGKSGLPRQQAESHEVSKIFLQAEHASRLFSITRTLQPADKHKLEADYLEKPITKAKEIEDALSGILGGSKHLLDKYVFVPQWGLRDLFNLTSGDRAKTLAHLCGTTHAELCWDIVGKQQDLDAELATTVVDNSDDLRQQIGDYTKRLETSQAALAAEQSVMLGPLALKDVEDTVRHEQRIKDAVAQMNVKTAAEKKLKATAVAANKAWKEVDEQRLAQDVVVNDCAEEHRQANEALAAFKHDKIAFDEYAARRKVLAAAKKELTELKKPVQPPEAKFTREQIDAAILDLNTKIAPHQAVIDQLGDLEGLADNAACPTCGQELDDPLKHLEEALRAVEPLNAERKVWSSRMEARLRYDQAVRKFEDEQGKIKQRIQERDARLLELTPIEAPVAPCDQDYVDELARKLLSARRQAEHLGKAVNAKFQERATAIANHQACKEEIKRLGAILAEAKGDHVYEWATEALATHRNAEKNAGIQEALVKEYAEQLRVKEQELTQLELVLSRSKRARGWVSLLATVRSVLHRDALPRIVHEAALRRMESGINEMLDTFESPFQVKTSPEDLSYVAYFRNGTVMPAQGLSGGQQVVLSLALRWTLNSLFASQIGMMVLDEPTAGLDARHIDLLEVALRGLGEAARSRGCQVIIITHERRLEGVFDQVIELERIVT